MGAIGGLKEFTGEQRANVVRILQKLIKDLANLTNLKGQQLYERLKEELKGKNIPDDVVDEAWKGSELGKANHKENIERKFRDVFKNKGISDEQISGALALMEARA